MNELKIHENIQTNTVQTQNCNFNKNSAEGGVGPEKILYGYSSEGPCIDYSQSKCMFTCRNNINIYQGPVVQIIVNLTSLLMVKMLTVLVSTISNSQVFLLKKCSFCQ